MRGLAGLLWQAEERPVASGAARTADVAIAVVATLAAVVAVIVQARSSSGPYGILIVRPGAKTVFLPQSRSWVAGWPSPWIMLGAALTTAPLAFRRIYPITTFCVIMLAVFATSGYTTTITFAAVIFASYTAAAYSPFRRLALLIVLLSGIIVTARYPDTSPPVPARSARCWYCCLRWRPGSRSAGGAAGSASPLSACAGPSRSTRPRPAAPYRRSGPGSPARCTTW